MIVAPHCRTVSIGASGGVGIPSVLTSFHRLLLLRRTISVSPSLPLSFRGFVFLGDSVSLPRASFDLFPLRRFFLRRYDGSSFIQPPPFFFPFSILHLYRPLCVLLRLASASLSVPVFPLFCPFTGYLFLAARIIN